VLVAVIAMSAFGLVLVLARRLRAVTERVNMFLPASPGTLPHPGTPVPEFEAVSADGEHLSRSAFVGVDRIFAVLSTECGPCEQQVSAFEKMGLAAGLAAAPTCLLQLRLARLHADVVMETSVYHRRLAFYRVIATDVRAAKEIRLFGLGKFLTGRMLRDLGSSNAAEAAVDRTAAKMQLLISVLTGLCCFSDSTWP
jgi:hypothetical protein